jgi:hypothetical protein
MGIIAVVAWVKDVAIPLVAAAITATGIVIPLRQERRKTVVIQQEQLDREREHFDKGVRALHRDVAFLVARAGLIVEKMTDGSEVTDEEIDVILGADRRWIARMFDDPTMWDAYFLREAWLKPERHRHLLLLLGEIDARLRRLRETRTIDLFTYFGLLLVQYAGEKDPAAAASLGEAIAALADGDREAREFLDNLPLDPPIT